ncbi:MAG: 8-amino-7-oxononanoate synthase [Nitrospirae bacterium]|nr:8-amino-7-oxononanoate synthase [Candidatus Manganitrophaceae bacterium]
MQEFKEILTQLRAEGLYRALLQIDSEASATVRLQGRDVLVFCANNYLGLANDARLKKAATEAIEAWGSGAGAARLVSGNIGLYGAVEKKLAQCKGTAAALVFSTGYMANLGAIGAIVKKGDLILADRLNHASLVDACRLSDARFRVYRHRDTAQLEMLLQKRNAGQNVLIVSDGVFSMEGDIAPLPEILRLADYYDAQVYLDDAHATGVLGENGGGTAAHFGCSSARLIQMGTFSKALGGFGGFVAGTEDLIHLLINKARPFIYTTALPASVLASALAALELFQNDPSLIQQLWRNRAYFVQKISELGFDILGSETPIVPLLIGSPEKALLFSKQLLEKDILVSAIRPPTVPKGTARLRVTLMASHTKEQIDVLLHELECIGQRLKVI